MTNSIKRHIYSVTASWSGAPTMFHVINALHLIVLTVVSWALRPKSRVLVNREVE